MHAWHMEAAGYPVIVTCVTCMQALEKLAPGDAAWQASAGKMVIGLSRMERKGLAIKWHAERVTEFASRAQVSIQHLTSDSAIH